MVAAANLEMLQVELLEEENDSFPSFTLGFDSKEYTVQRGKKVWVPFWAAVLAFGDPRSGPSVVTIREPGSNATLDRKSTRLNSSHRT